MFENIIGQTEIIAALSHELESGTFPRAALFSGPAYAGRLSAALETARALTCEKRGEWSCDCVPCGQHRLLLHPYTILAGPRAWRTEFRAARDTLERTRSAASRFLFLRAVRKLTRRFDPHIFQAEESRRREIQELLLALEEALPAFEPAQTLPEGKAGERLFDSVAGLCGKLEGFLPKDNIPIAVIRNISQWAAFTAPSVKKIVILENASRLLEASRNALLKILEEPPPDLHFILIAERAADLIPTIRSRLRDYRFRPRRPEETRELLHRVFKEDNPQYTTLKSYFLAWEDIHLESLNACARRFAEKILDRESVFVRHEIPELFRRDAPRELYRYFLEELVAVLQSFLRSGEGSPAQAPTPLQAPPPLTRFESWMRLIRTRAHEFFTLNISPALFIEGLFLALRDAA